MNGLLYLACERVTTSCVGKQFLRDMINLDSPQEGNYNIGEFYSEESFAQLVKRCSKKVSSSQDAFFELCGEWAFFLLLQNRRNKKLLDGTVRDYISFIKDVDSMFFSTSRFQVENVDHTKLVISLRLPYTNFLPLLHGFLKEYFIYRQQDVNSELNTETLIFSWPVDMYHSVDIMPSSAGGGAESVLQDFISLEEYYWFTFDRNLQITNMGEKLGVLSDDPEETRLLKNFKFIHPSTDDDGITFSILKLYCGIQKDIVIRHSSSKLLCFKGHFYPNHTNNEILFCGAYIESLKSSSSVSNEEALNTAQNSPGKGGWEEELANTNEKLKVLTKRVRDQQKRLSILEKEKLFSSLETPGKFWGLSTIGKKSASNNPSREDFFATPPSPTISPVQSKGDEAASPKSAPKLRNFFSKQKRGSSNSLYHTSTGNLNSHRETQNIAAREQVGTELNLNEIKEDKKDKFQQPTSPKPPKSDKKDKKNSKAEEAILKGNSIIEKPLTPILKTPSTNPENKGKSLIGGNSLEKKNKKSRPKSVTMVTGFSGKSKGAVSSDTIAPLAEPTPAPAPRSAVNWAIDLQDLKFENMLGSGAFGEVWRAKYMNQDVAVKMLKKDVDWFATGSSSDSENSSDKINKPVSSEQDLEEQALSCLQKEFRILNMLQHDNIVHFYGGRMNVASNLATCSLNTGNLSTPNKSLLVQEYCERGNLKQFLNSEEGKTLSWEDKVKLTLDIARGLQYLHEFTPAILHRDLKDLNVLITHTGKNYTLSKETSSTSLSPNMSDGGKGGSAPTTPTMEFGLIAKLCDFGGSKDTSLNTTMGYEAGSLQWMAPEVFEGEKRTKASDIYGMGLIMWFMVAARTPWGDGAGLLMVTKSVCHGKRPEMSKEEFGGVPEEYQKLMEQCWTHIPSDRPTAAQVVSRLEQIV
eukprot:TRINITY_DN2897_c0_g1_i1.p1 TRINITY_DN2897_c0_g1~~TRINITY_DN2897_c0_g1_i1.p1  ORF type:complete len:962 (-),score=214.78 TRINITY_DN2897_c0_g1_i1:440-3199(-)